MDALTSSPTTQRVLVSDFDGTMTRHDFYKLAIDALLPAEMPDYWSLYRAKEITHFEALRRYFALIRASEATVLSVVARMEIDPRLADSVRELRHAGWQLVVASAGCEWYIDSLLQDAGVSLEVHANPGRFENGNGLQMRLPTESSYFSANLGIDKTAIVRSKLDAGMIVAFAGDGFPDVEPARLVPAELRFARGDLAETLRKEGLSFHPFAVWSDIAEHLLH